MLPKEIASQIVWPDGLSSELKQQLCAVGQLVKDIKPKPDSSYEPASGIWYVLDGVITLYMQIPSLSTVNSVVLGRGDWFGHFDETEENNPFIQVVQVIPLIAVFMPSEQIMRLAQTNHEVYKWYYLQGLIMKPKWLQAQVIRSGSVMERIIYILLDIAARQGSSVKATYPIPLSQNQLSLLTDISRQRVNEALKALERAQAIEVHRGQILLTDISKLATRLQGYDLAFHNPLEIMDTRQEN
ncbi:Crp/Fnr family transcriptional regulator [Neiella sp. HB171785]|uniref:Crp/Fnr family transcriptional regulator n=2 Tax=Neiella TaxID=1434025 RepID=A0A8J6QQS9_9GAMM|nr:MULTISPECIES: Crp/Fnr family transcriptional regulator [Neiella]MBD1389631.1 Crp/Fnr family transcriptional regulator [Neiella litorisoli]GGA76940.1 hypothetical protein GCM10011369_18560 [Neiella marina]